jgi:hypothetical protein
MFLFLDANLLASPWYIFSAWTHPEVDCNIFLSWHEAMEHACEMHCWLNPHSKPSNNPPLWDLHDTKQDFRWQDLCFTQLAEHRNLRYKRKLPYLSIVVPEPPAPKKCKTSTGPAECASRTPSIMSSVYRTEWPGIFDD